MSHARKALEVRMGTVMRALAATENLSTTLLWDVETAVGKPEVPAWFSPEERTVTINATFALQGESPSGVNPLTPDGRRRHPHIIGLGCHEAAHVRFTCWGEEERSLLESESPSVREIVTLLEEPRIEGRFLQVRPFERLHLRAQSILLDVSQFLPPTDEDRERMEEEGGWVDGWRAAVLCILTLARGDAGVLEKYDLIAPRRVLSLALGDTLDQLETLWQEALALRDGDMKGMIDVARRWVEIVGERPEGLRGIASCDGVPPEPEEFADDGGGASGYESETEAVGPPDDLSWVAEGLVTTLSAEYGAEAESQAEVDEIKKQREEDSRKEEEIRKKQKRGKTIFEKLTSDDPEKSRAQLVDPEKRRAPTDDERQLAVSLRKVIKKARFRDKDRFLSLSEVPPGRLDGREAVLYAAQRSMRMQTTAKPFRTSLSRYTEEPPLLVGVMTDTSGSMRAFQPFATAFSWALAQAIAGMGKSIAVAFQTKVSVLNLPGEVPPKVFPLSSDGGGENWKAAFSVVDGALNLTTGSGVRLVFVFSDGDYYMKGQGIAARDDLVVMAKSGVRVIWIAPGGKENGANDLLFGLKEHRLICLDLANHPLRSRSLVQLMTELVSKEISEALLAVSQSRRSQA